MEVSDKVVGSDAGMVVSDEKVDSGADNMNEDGDAGMDVPDENVNA